MCKKVSTFDEIEKMFKDYFNNGGLFIQSRSAYELVLEMPLFPSKFSHSFASNVWFSVCGIYDRPSDSFRVVVRFYVTK